MDKAVWERKGRPQDQVARRAAFSAAHPEVSIELCRETWTWEATYPASGSGVHTVHAPELREVLDRLERVFPPDARKRGRR